MKVVFDKSFSKSLGKFKNKPVLNAVQKAIEDCEAANSLKEIQNFRKLKGYRNYYRIKMGNYRIGLEKQGEILRFIVLLHRKNIYNKFP